MTPNLTPEGSISLSEDYLRDMIADCPAFQAWVGATTATKAKERVYVCAAPLAEGAEYTEEELLSLRPFALVYADVEEGFEVRAVAGDGPFSYVEHGSLVAEFECSVPACDAELHAVVSRRFKNFIGNVINELQARSGLPGFPALTAITLAEGPVRSHPDERQEAGDYMMARLRMRWGLEQSA